MSNTLTEKQDYLRKEILEKGYDANEFSTFIDSYKENGGDLNNWNMEELFEVVNQFINKNSNNNCNNNDNNNSDNKNENESMNNNVNDVNTTKDKNENITIGMNENDTNDLTNEEQKFIAPSSNKSPNSSKKTTTKKEPKKQKLFKDFVVVENPNQQEEIIDIINCVQLKQNDLSKISDLKIEIKELELKSAGLFSSSYYSFALECPSMKTKVYRKVNDIFELRDILVRQFPGVLIPPLPTFSSWGKYKDEELKEKEEKFNFFINELVSNPLIRSYRLTLNFIILPKESYDTEFVRFNRLQKVTNLSNFSSLTGTVDASLRQGSTFRSKEIKKYVEKRTPVVNNVIWSVKELIKEYDVLKTKYNDLLKNLNELEKEFSSEHLNNKYIPSILNEFNKSIENANSFQLKIKDFLNSSVRNFFEYLQLEYNEFGILLTSLKSAESSFLEAQNDLKGERNNIEKKKKEKQVLNTRRFFYFMQNMIEDENQRLIDNQVIRMRNIFGNKEKIYKIFEKDLIKLFECINRINNIKIEKVANIENEDEEENNNEDDICTS